MKRTKKNGKDEKEKKGKWDRREENKRREKKKAENKRREKKTENKRKGHIFGMRVLQKHRDSNLSTHGMFANVISQKKDIAAFFLLFF